MNDMTILNQLRLDTGLHNCVSELLQGTVLFSSTRADPPILYSVDQLIQQIKDAQGWCQYTDKFHRGTLIEGKNNIIEGEWHKDGTTIKAQLLQHNSYQISRMEINKGNKEYWYHEQNIICRQSDKNHKDRYRIWWDCINDRYQPIAQQYMGSINNTKENHS